MNTPDWIWYAEDDDGKPVISLGRWPKTAGQVRYIQAPIQPTEHDHPIKGTGTKLDPKALEAALERWATSPISGSPQEDMQAAIIAYCQAAGVVMVSTHVLETAANCINDLAVGAGGWAHEEVADELRAMVAAAREGE